MNITPETPRTVRNIGGKRKPDAPFNPNAEVSFEINVPSPYAAGAVTLSEGEANALNQIIAENLSNNLRAKLLAGTNDGEGTPTRDFTAEEAQKLADDYLAEYEMGVRRAGSGEPRVTDPVEKEARAIARETALGLIKQSGRKTTEVDVPAITAAVFEKNRDKLMAKAKKIVDQRNKALAGGDELDLGVELTAKPEPTPAETQG